MVTVLGGWFQLTVPRFLPPEIHVWMRLFINLFIPTMLILSPSLLPSSSLPRLAEKVIQVGG